MKEIIQIDGKPISDKLAYRSIFYGEGVFETFRWKSKLPNYFNRHIERIQNGAKSLGIPYPSNEIIRNAILKGLLEAGILDAYVKIALLSVGNSVYYEDPSDYSILIVIREYERPKSVVDTTVSSYRRNSSSPVLRIKSLNYLENILAKREAISSGYDGALFLNEKGEVTEGTVSNVFFIRDDVLFTPAPECGLLKGVVRGVVIEVAKENGFGMKEGRFDLSILKTSDVIFLTNSLMGAVLVSSVDDRRFSNNSKLFEKIETGLLEKLGWD
ncbi:aminotransferase class IV [Desulfobacterota bacterium AH_259_B03_O07]|nr:aminotransferase class IV [Desulfobacterota bacterium AH_259_B03_O07]